MKKAILVAGATGNLGEKICYELLKRGAAVRAAVRFGSDNNKIKLLKDAGIEVVEVDFTSHSMLENACSGVSCVVSALAGLKDVIVDTQAALLNAAVSAGVPHFIPSDFCTDYTNLPEGCNRNFDLRKAFAEIIDSSPIHATSVFNGAFSYVLHYDIPLLNTNHKTIGFFEDKSDWNIDFTTLENTATFTASAALDSDAPRYLRIAGFSISPEALLPVAEKVYKSSFQLENMGSMERFLETIYTLRREQPEGENELYPAWQQMQYLYSMFAAHHQELDNERYSGIVWIGAEEALSKR